MPKLAMIVTAPTPSASDSARVKLADAIATRDALQRDADTLAEAESGSRQATYNARRGMEAAERELTAGKAAAAQHAVDLVMGNVGGDAPSLTPIRARVTDGIDALDIARQAEAIRAARLEETRISLGFAQNRVKNLAIVLFQDTELAAAAVERAHKAQVEMLEATTALKWLVDRAGIGAPPGSAANETNTLAARIRVPPQEWNSILRGPKFVGASHFQSAFETLCRDAHAPMPE